MSELSIMKSLDWEEILEQTKKFASSAIARDKIFETGALKTAEEAASRCQEILESLIVIQSGVRPHMESLDLFATWFMRIKKQAVLKPVEIRDVRLFCLEVVALKEAVGGMNSTFANNIDAGLMNAERPLSAIDQLITAGGDIRMDASERLYSLSREKESLARQIQNTLDRLSKDHQMDSYLQERFVTTREGRWVLPVRGGMQHFVPGVIHGTSQTKQTVYMEPEVVVPMNNRMRQIEVEIEDEIERLLTEISMYLAGLVSDFSTSREWLEHADITFAHAQLAQRLEGVQPQFDSEKIILNSVKHPLLVLSKKSVIANSVELGNDGKRILLLSGPNAGGKTVLLKSIGLAAQMARCGLPIAAGESSCLPFFEEVCVAIGDAQNVDEDLSTFAAHLKKLNEASQLKGSKNLVLVDEICGSTDPEEGSALARSFIETYANNKVFAVVTSHLGPLKTGWSNESHVVNGSLEYDVKSGKPTYQFLSGIPGESLAIQTAKRVGVDLKIVNRALEVLSPATQARLSKLDEIEQMKSDLNILKDHLKKELALAEKNKNKYDHMLSEFQRERDKKLEAEVKKASKKVEEALAHAKVESVFKKHERLSEIKHQLPEIVKAPAQDSSQWPSVARSGAPQTGEEFAKRYPPGTKVYVASLGRDGIVQSAPNNKGEVMVLSGPVRLNIPWKDLGTPDKPKNPTADLARRAGGFSFSVADQDHTLDLRGKTVDEAVGILEMELDRATHQKEDRIKIIHGHGTEALKKTVRSYLSRSLYVKQWKAGGPEHGGDGVTWAELAND